MLATFTESPRLLVGLIVSALALSILYSKITLYLTRRKFKLQHGLKPIERFYPLKDPIFGIDNLFESIKAKKELRLLERFRSNFDNYGHTFKGKLITQNLIATREPENVKAILSLKFKDFGLGDRQRAFGPLLGKGIFTMDGDFWAHSRALIRPNFARDQVADLEAFERHIQALWRLIPRDGRTVDLQELFFRFTIDSATEFLFGVSTHTLDEGPGAEKGTHFAKSFTVAQDACAHRSRLGILAPFFPDREADKANKFCHEFVGQFVDEAIRYRESGDVEKKGDEDKYVFLRQLAADTKDKTRLQDELLNVLLAGRDTTASLLSNMWIQVAKDPAIFAKLRKEVNENFPDGELPTYEKLRNMKYLKWCMNESLRLHPVVPMNGRFAIRDTFIPLGGGPEGKDPLFVPKGYAVSYSVYAMHRRKDLYGEDADEYRPERWETLRPGWEYLPFNGGPRICLGQQYALTEAGYVTSRLCQEFSKVESTDPEPWKENVTLTLCSHNGTLVSLTPAEAQGA
jgi:cytochrome P450